MWRQTAACLDDAAVVYFMQTYTLYADGRAKAQAGSFFQLVHGWWGKGVAGRVQVM